MKLISFAVALVLSTTVFLGATHVAFAAPCPNPPAGVVYEVNACSNKILPDGSREYTYVIKSGNIGNAGPGGKVVTTGFDGRIGTTIFYDSSGREVGRAQGPMPAAPTTAPTAGTPPAQPAASPPAPPQTGSSSPVCGEGTACAAAHKKCTAEAADYTGGYYGCMAAQFGSFTADTAGSIFGDWVGLPFMWWVLSVTAYMYFIAAQFLLWFGTTLFDNVIFYLVINMGVFIQSTNVQSGILTAWTAIRDLMNIGIIAGFIIVGISTILQSQQYSANRFLARLIIAALLVNFSYFFAGAVIDSSNYITQQIYKSKIVTSGCTEAIAKNLSVSVRYTVTGFVPPSELCSMSASFMKILKLGSWTDIKNLAYKQEKQVNAQGGTIDTNKIVTFVGFLGGLFYVITGFVFFSAAILLLGRFVVLILLLITSPVGVAGANIPYLDEYAKKWWSMLFAQAFFAPIFVLLVGIGLKIITDMSQTFKTGGALTVNYAAIAMGRWQEAVNSIPIFITFFVGIALMYAALQISRSMSESGKEYVGGIYGGLQKSLGSVYGDLYQATAANALSIPSKAYDATLGQMAKVPYVGQYLTFVGKALRPDMGAKPFGASKSMAESQKETQDYMKSLPNTAGYVLDPKKTFQKIKTQMQNFGTWLAEDDVHKLIERAHNGEKLDDAQRRRVERYVQSLKDEDIERMTHGELAEIAPFMSVKQFKKTMERSDLNDSQRKEIQDSRWSEIKKAKEEGRHDDAAKLLGDMDKTERKILFAERDEIRTDKRILAALEGKVFDEMTSDKSLYSDDKELKDIKDHRASTIGAGLQNDATRSSTLKNMSDSDRARIRESDLTPKVVAALTPAEAHNIYKHNRDPKVRAKILEKYPHLDTSNPAIEDEEEQKKKEDEEKKKEEEEKKKEEEEEEAADKKKKDDTNKH